MTTNLWGVVGLCALLAACANPRADASADTAGAAGGTSADASTAVAAIRQVPIAGGRRLREISGIAMSRVQDGVLFTVDDSGNEPTLYAFDTAGADRGSWRVSRALNRDWEAIATAPCGSRNCVYIGDVGDNNASVPTHRIYRVVEPSGPTDSARASFFEFEYPDGAHDVEAMYVTPSADIFLITKRPLTRGGNRLRPALVYSVPAAIWKDSGHGKATLVDSLPIVPGAEPLMLVTDASLSPDGKLLAVRTYTQTYIFPTNAATGRVDHTAKYVVCDVVPLGEAQGEGVAWIGTGRLAFTSEGKKQPLRLATCPVP